MEVTLRGESIRCEQDLHRQLCEQLDFGPYYGNNIAALRDRLEKDIERPVKLIWMDSKYSRQVLGDELYFQIVHVFQYIEEQDKSFGWKERFTFLEG